MIRTPYWILTHWIIPVLTSRLLSRCDQMHPCTQQMTNRSFGNYTQRSWPNKALSVVFQMKWIIRHSHIYLFHLCNDRTGWPWGVWGIDSLLSSVVTPVGPIVCRFLVSANHFNTLDFEILKDQKFLTVSVD